MDELQKVFNQIFNLQDPTGKTIVYWIRIFFWVGVINYGVHLARLGYEYICLKFVQIKIRKGVDVISSDFLNRLAKSVVIRTSIRGSIVYRRIRDLVKIKQNGGEIDHDVLGDIHAAVASRKAGLSNYILGILIILGLVGTLWGLTTAVIEVQPLLEDIDDLDQLSQISNALQETLKGMGTAFKTTLAGLVTSLGLGALGWLFSLSNSAFLTQFETVVTTEIIPHFKHAPESTIESSIDQLQVSVGEFKLATEDNVRRMQASIQQLTEKSWDAYLEQQYVIANELDKIPGELRESLAGINEYQVLIKSTVESFETSTESFIAEIKNHQSTVTGFNSKVESFETSTESFIAEIKNYQTTVDTMVKDFKGTTNQSISQVAEYQKTLLGGLENVVSELKEESKGLRTTIGEAQTSHESFMDDTKNLTETFGKQLESMLQPIVKNQQDVVTGLRETSSDISEMSGKLQNQTKSAVESFETSTNKFMTKVENHQSTVDTMVKDFKGTTNQSISQVAEYQKTLLDGLGNMVSELKEESKGLRTTISEAQTSHESFMDDAKNLTKTFGEQLESMLQPIVKNQQDVVSELQETSSHISEMSGELQIRSALEKQNGVFQEIKSELIQSQQEMSSRLSELSEFQIIPTLEAQNKVFGQIETHLQEQRDLVDEQQELMKTLNSSVNQLQQVFSKSESDEQQHTEKMLQQLTQNFDELGKKIDALNDTITQSGSGTRRWFLGNRK
ncbi:MAG: hypothetical protein OXH00_18505 [Candidatus Poribacteria bacterium]|nr:hypothetical protein [Candidatus Poribacteria bacterium]